MLPPSSHGVSLSHIALLAISVLGALLSLPRVVLGDVLRDLLERSAGGITLGDG
jgi:hypothetical protein